MNAMEKHNAGGDDKEFIEEVVALIKGKPNSASNLQIQGFVQSTPPAGSLKGVTIMKEFSIANQSRR